MPPLARGPPVAHAPQVLWTQAVPGIRRRTFKFTPVSANPYQAPLRPATSQIRSLQVTKLSIIVAGAPLQVSAGPPPVPPLPEVPLAPALPALPAFPALPALPAFPAFPASPAFPAFPRSRRPPQHRCHRRSRRHRWPRCRRLCRSIPSCRPGQTRSCRRRRTARTFSRNSKPGLHCSEWDWRDRRNLLRLPGRRSRLSCRHRKRRRPHNRHKSRKHVERRSSHSPHGCVSSAPHGARMDLPTREESRPPRRGSHKTHTLPEA